MRICAAAALGAAVFLPAAVADFSLVSLSQYVDARCLDGSPAAFYIRPNSTSDRWVLWFEGGGWCQDVPSCAARAGTRLGSSTSYAPTATFQGILNEDAGWNPEFYDANLVYAKYCDGSSFSSFVSAPVPVNSTFNLTLRGHAILDALLQELTTNHGLGSRPAALVVTGSSAGGLSSYLHVDYISSSLSSLSSQGLLPGPVTTVGMPDAGFFLPGPDIHGDDSFLASMQTVVQFFNMSGSAEQGDADCWSSTPPSLRWRCFLPPFLYRHVSSPIFVLNAAYDYFQLGVILGLPGGCVTQPLTGCNATQYSQFQGWRSLFVSTLGSALAEAPAASMRNGGFISSCVQHEEGYVDRRWSNDTIAGVAMRDAFAAWFSATVAAAPSAGAAAGEAGEAAATALRTVGGTAEQSTAAQKLRPAALHPGATTPDGWPWWWIDTALWPNNPSCQAPGP